MNDKIKQVAASKTSKWVAALLAVTGVAAAATYLHARYQRKRKHK